MCALPTVSAGQAEREVCEYYLQKIIILNSGQSCVPICCFAGTRKDAISQFNGAILIL